MATNFPTSLDDSSSLPVESGSTPLATNHVASHQNIQDSIEAIEAKVGINSSAVTTSHDYKLSTVTGANKAVSSAGGITLTSMTLTSSTINGVTPTTAGSATTFLNGVGNYTTPSTVNSSTTVAGSVEAATSAEVTAGTATGGTGAVLAVTPDALASSTPVFNASALTSNNALRVTRLAGYSPASNTTENTVYTTTITGGLLGVNGMIKAQTPVAWGSNATAETWTLRLKYGGSTLLTATFQSTAVGGGNNSNAQAMITAWIINNAATNSQNVTFFLSGGANILASANQTPIGVSDVADTTSAIDTTSNQTLTMTVQRTNGAGGSATFHQTIVETMKNI